MLCTEPLTMAQENNHDECARLLLSSGAKPKHTYFLGYEMKLVHLENLKGPLTKAAELVKACDYSFPLTSKNSKRWS